MRKPLKTRGALHVLDELERDNWQVANNVRINPMCDGIAPGPGRPRLA